MQEVLIVFITIFALAIIIGIPIVLTESYHLIKGRKNNEDDGKERYSWGNNEKPWDNPSIELWIAPEGESPEKGTWCADLRVYGPNTSALVNMAKEKYLEEFRHVEGMDEIYYNLLGRILLRSFNPQILRQKIDFFVACYSMAVTDVEGSLKYLRRNYGKL